MGKIEMTSIQIASDEYLERNHKLIEILHKKKLNRPGLFGNFYILYYTGFAFIPTERPIAYLLSSSGKKLLFVPRLEQEHALSSSMIDQVEIYQEYPFNPHPMELLGDLLKQLGISGDYGADQDGYPWILGYRGQILSELDWLQAQESGWFH